MGLTQRLRSWLIPPPTVASAWTAETVYTDGDRWFTALIEAIAEARQSVWLETYILDEDALGGRILSSLQAAAARGVEVRLLLDGIGSADWVRNQARHPPDLPIRVWNPLPWVLAHRLSFSRRWRWLVAINRRDHRKVCLIDGASAWVGSLNCSGVHAASVSGDRHWRDTGAQVSGPGITALETAYRLGWRRAWPLRDGQLRFRLPLPTFTRASPLDLRVRLNHTGSTRRAAYRHLLGLIHSAKRRIWITNAYVVPKGSLVRALAKAAKRGVDVRVLGPGVSDHPVMPWVAACFADGLLRAGARVYAYRQRILHAKTMLIDDLALVGSHNLNHRSLVHDLEAEVILDHPASIAALEAAFTDDLAAADELHPPALAHLRWWQRLAARTALLAKRWL